MWLPDDQYQSSCCVPACTLNAGKTALLTSAVFSGALGMLEACADMSTDGKHWLLLKCCLPSSPAGSGSQAFAPAGCAKGPTLLSTCSAEQDSDRSLYTSTGCISVKVAQCCSFNCKAEFSSFACHFLHTSPGMQTSVQRLTVSRLEGISSRQAVHPCCCPTCMPSTSVRSVYEDESFTACSTVEMQNNALPEYYWATATEGCVHEQT